MRRNPTLYTLFLNLNIVLQLYNLINYSRNKKDKVIPWIHQAGVITKMNFSAFDDFYNFAISNLLIKM